MRKPHNLLPYGPTALLLSWEQRIDPGISASVHAYALAISKHPAVRECVPAYASLLVTFDLSGTTADKLSEYIFDLQPALEDQSFTFRHELPVLYDGPDLEYILGKLSMSKNELIELHSGRDYLVYQLGFQPGFAFLGDTDERLEVARRAEPRRRVPAGSVGLAGRQTGIYPAESPGGWQLIGRCPWPILRAGADAVRLRAGDYVRFRAVTEAEFTHLEKTTSPWPER